MSTPSDLILKLRPLFEPASVAVVGASNDPSKWGFRILSNILSGGFKGRVYAVNPNVAEAVRLKTYPRVTDIPEVPDLVVIVVPPPAVPPVMRDCAEKGVRAVVVITAGFAEIGGEGERLQQEITDIARAAGIRFVGPNSFGILNPVHGLYSQMPPIFPPAGPFGVISQSGNIIGTIARLLIGRAFGCSKCVSIGNQADLRAEDYLEYFAQDPHTRVILCYIEGFKDGARFFNMAKEVSKEKPIILLKAGQTPAGAKAARSHTASLAGSDAVIAGMCKQAGIIRVKTLDELVDVGIAFLRQPLPRGRRVGVVTAGGGWGVLAADACDEMGLNVVSLPPETIEELDSFMPPWWNRGNPVDLVAGTSGEGFFRVLEVVLRCPAVDGVIMLGLMPILAPGQFRRPSEGDEKEQMREAMVSGAAELFDRLNELSDRYNKPVVVASEPFGFGAALNRRITHAIADRNSVYYEMPHQAASVFAKLVQYGEYRRQWQ